MSKRPSSKRAGKDAAVAKPLVKKTFGTPLEEQELIAAPMPSDPSISVQVPAIAAHSIQAMLANGAADEVGIFRVPGVGSRITEWKERYDADPRGEKTNVSEEPDVNTIAGMFKLWLRELPEPVLIFRYYTTFTKVARNQDQEAMERNLRLLLWGLPQRNRELLFYLMDFLRKVVANEARNKMGYDNVAMVFAPNLLRAQSEDYDMIVRDTPVVKHALRTIMERLDFMRQDPKTKVKNILEQTAARTPSSKEIITDLPSSSDGTASLTGSMTQLPLVDATSSSTDVPPPADAASDSDAASSSSAAVASSSPVAAAAGDAAVPIEPSWPTPAEGQEPEYL